MFSHTWSGGFTFGAVVAFFVLFVAYRLSVALDKKSKTNSPFKISFDPKNPLHIRQEDAYWDNNGDRFEIDEYRIEIENVTDKTIRGVTCAIQGQTGYRKFIMSETIECSLHPRASDYIVVLRHNTANPADIDDEGPADFLLVVKGEDAKACRKRVHVDSRKCPVLSLSS